jgi:hypothetical protein
MLACAGKTGHHTRSSRTGLGGNNSHSQYLCILQAVEGIAFEMAWTLGMLLFLLLMVKKKAPAFRVAESKAD